MVFPATVRANGTSTYTIQIGLPAIFQTKACGHHYPERADDVAWENELVAFRAYGPALQATGERAFGYDIWTKCNTTEPVVEARYADELNPEIRVVIEELNKTDPEAAKTLYKSVSYHIDHGNGLDCYKVGPTLGGGTIALMIGDTIRGDSNVVETRVISLDTGSHMNRTVVSYKNLNEIIPVVTGIALHEPNGTI